MALLEVEDLEVRFGLRSGEVTALYRISFSLDRGQRFGIVGESGAGKSIAAFSILNLLSAPGYIAHGRVRFDGRDLLTLTPAELRQVRGNRISMIFQDPMMTLNPVMTVGDQMTECLRAHTNKRGEECRRIALEKLQLVQIPSPEKRLEQYPHELSGGMKQRIVIAIALLLDPDIIIADEPTTALDVTIQAEIMDLLLALCESRDLGLILITHDLGVVSQVTQDMIVMYAGSIIEAGSTRQVIHCAQHPYTQGLINALPQQAEPGAKLNQIPGSMPTLQRIPSGCAFHPRCPYVMPRCEVERPEFTLSGGVRVACHLVEEWLVASAQDNEGTTA